MMAQMRKKKREIFFFWCGTPLKIIEIPEQLHFLKKIEGREREGVNRSYRMILLFCDILMKTENIQRFESKLFLSFLFANARKGIITKTLFVENLSFSVTVLCFKLEPISEKKFLLTQRKTSKVFRLFFFLLLRN